MSRGALSSMKGFGSDFTKDWCGRTVVMCLTEVVAVFFILTAHQRLGDYDLFSQSLTMFLTLVVFTFPFINTYVFMFLRLGPWFKPDHIVRTLTQVLLVFLSHGLGSFSAWRLHTEIVKNRFDDAGFISNDNATVLVGVKYRESSSANTFDFFVEEAVAVFVLLVGLLHLIEADLHSLLCFTFWNVDAVRVEEKVIEQDAPPSKDTNDQKPPDQDGKGYKPISMPLIIHFCLLLAGIVRAFPSAHLSFHTTLFKGYALEPDFPSTFLIRIIGGLFGTFLALVYYHFMYMVIHTKSVYGITNPLKKLIVDYRNEPGVYMESLLLLPEHMKQARE